MRFLSYLLFTAFFSFNLVCKSGVFIKIYMYMDTIRPLGTSKCLSAILTGLLIIKCFMKAFYSHVLPISLSNFILFKLVLDYFITAVNHVSPFILLKISTIIFFISISFVTWIMSYPAISKNWTQILFLDQCFKKLLPYLNCITPWYIK